MYDHFSLNYSITDILQLFISLLKLLHFNNIYRHIMSICIYNNIYIYIITLKAQNEPFSYWASHD